MRIYSLTPNLSYSLSILQRKATRRFTTKRRFGDNAYRLNCTAYLSLFAQLQLDASSKKTSIRNEPPFTYTEALPSQPFIMNSGTEREKQSHHIYVGSPSKRCIGYRS